MLAHESIVQAKYLPKSRQLSKVILSGMEVVTDDFCLLHLRCYICTNLGAFSLHSFFQDLSPPFSSTTPARYQYCLLFLLHMKAIAEFCKIRAGKLLCVNFSCLQNEKFLYE